MILKAVRCRYCQSDQLITAALVNPVNESLIKRFPDQEEKVGLKSLEI